ncbi:MAG: helix-turn-helix domain-containing protein [Actinomycetota bacterium]
MLTCFAGCSRQSVLDSIGLDWSDLFDDAPRVSAEQLMPDTVAGRERPPEWSRFGHVRTVMTVLEQLEEFAFNGPTCRPSQQLLADLTGLSRETVNRCLAKMRGWGWIDWRYERRPGAKWWHCVYTIKLTWTRPLRKKLLKRLDALRGANRLNPFSTKDLSSSSSSTHSSSTGSFSVIEGALRFKSGSVSPCEARAGPI